ncbi:UNKNOWN [Stylonychia lemnae]|uniref:Uncharacterized protein n=1 Tax=Stylonychia lemnae TaxID=5949 RepID=A0A077ZSF6_STYLE|nr:UNKNOWN [Stylonychia lemnae]|eukprot:CDW72479.1 UNKNOWN [Stylonychia lemnae]
MLSKQSPICKPLPSLEHLDNSNNTIQVLVSIELNFISTMIDSKIFSAINEKLSKTQASIRQQDQNDTTISKIGQLEIMDSRLMTIDGSINSVQDKYQKKFNEYKEQLIEEDKQYKEQLAEIKAQEIKSLEQKVFERFDQEAANDFPKLQEEIRNESNDREELDNTLIKKINEESQKLVETIQGEKKAREETEESILELLRDMVNRIKAELENEKKERESSEETLLSLLEETCTKLNTATLI